jgi:predicted RecB family nuclease
MQGAYPAKHCPVRAQYDRLRPVEPLVASPAMERLFKRGREFESDVVAEMLSLHHASIEDVSQGVSGRDWATLEANTVAAIEQDVPLIAGGRLPSDPVGRRVGEPDILVSTGDGHYWPVDIKHHRTTEAATTNRPVAACSALKQPSLTDAAEDPASQVRKRKEDLLQLAHYQRMLEACGLASPDGRHGAIIGVERRIVWYDLDAPLWQTPSSTGKQKKRSTMEVYDFEFDFRLDVIAQTQQHMEDASVPLPVVPAHKTECSSCPWHDYCLLQLEEGSGDVSLIPHVGWTQRKIHLDRGVADRAAVASLDMTTAQLLAKGVDVTDLLEQAKDAPSTEAVAKLPRMGRRKTQLANLESAGFLTVEDLQQLSPLVAGYPVGFSSLPEQIDRARAALGPEAAYRRRGLPSIPVVRADVEVDIDMENVEEGVYLWGTLVTRPGEQSKPEYLPFSTWDPLTPEVLTSNFLEFWNWLMQLQTSTEDSGKTLKAYCYSAQAENGQLRTLAREAGILDQVDVFINSEAWVDMLKVFDDSVITGAGSGLKTVAKLAGFGWRAKDAGGDASMAYYETAVTSPDADEREAARRWLLEYNEDDVLATLAIREWLAQDGDSIAPIETLDP